MNKKTVLVVSKRGFIGSCLSRTVADDPSIDAHAYSSDEFNLLDPIHVAEVISNFKKPFTFVFLATQGRFPTDNFAVFDRNVRMAKNVVAALKNSSVEHVIFTSSACVYGRPPLELPIRETTVARPTGHYGLSKFVSEELLKLNLNCPVSIPRIPGVYGPNDKGLSIIAAFVRDLKAGRPINLWGDGEQMRDFIYIDDVVNLIRKLIDKPLNKTFLFASGQPRSMKDVANITLQAYGGRGKVVFGRPEMTSQEFDLTYDLDVFRGLFPGFSLTGLEVGVPNYLKSIQGQNPVSH